MFIRISDKASRYVSQCWYVARHLAAFPYCSLTFSVKATLRLFPGITAATIRAFLSPPVQGVVLETFGAGNAPQRADLMQALKEACDRGVIVVAISQCAKGTVNDAYQTGRALEAVGVASGGDMTTEVRASSSKRHSVWQCDAVLIPPM